MGEVFYWDKTWSKDPIGWYVQWRNEFGSIVEVAGPFDTSSEAHKAARASRLKTG
jgi:hypothetical protein